MFTGELYGRVGAEDFHDARIFSEGRVRLRLRLG
jgi:hypothetical protein